MEHHQPPTSAPTPSPPSDRAEQTTVTVRDKPPGRKAAALRAWLAALKSGGWPAVLSCAAIFLAVLHAVKPQFTIDGTTIALLVVALLPWFKDVLKSIELPGGTKILFQDMKAFNEALRAALRETEGSDVRTPQSPGRGLILGQGLGDRRFAYERHGIGDVGGPLAGTGADVAGGDRHRVATIEDVLSRQDAAENEALKRTNAQIASLREIADANPGMAFVGFGIEVEKKINALFERTFPDSPQQFAAGRKVSMLGQAGMLNRSLAYAIAELMRLRNQAAHGAAVEPEAAEWLLDVGPDLLFELEKA